MVCVGSCDLYLRYLDDMQQHLVLKDFAVTDDMIV